MEVDYKSQDGDSSNFNQTDEHLESSTTDESSGIYNYYPSLEIPHTTKKVRSRLGKGGKRRTNVTAFRMSTDITEPINDTNTSNNSTEERCSDVISRDIAVCPVSEKVDFPPDKNRNNATLDKESCSVPLSEQSIERRGLRNVSSVPEKMDITPKKILNSAILDQENCPIVERRGFKNVSNSIQGNNYKSAPPFFQEKSTDTNKTESIQDFLYVPITEQKIPNLLQIANNPIYKTPLKQTNDNIFTGSATKVNHIPARQSNTVKNLVPSKFIADTAKENVLSSFDQLKTNKKPSDIFSSATQREKNATNALKTAESLNSHRNKQPEVSLSHKTLSKVTSLNDLPLDLKMKFKPETKQEPSSIKTTQDSPPRPSYLSLGPPFNPNVSENPFKEPCASTVKRHLCDTSPQKVAGSDGYESYSVLNLSLDKHVKTSNPVNNSVAADSKTPLGNQLNITEINTASFTPTSNSSFIVSSDPAKQSNHSPSVENKPSQANQLNTTDINTASFIPTSNSSFIGETESAVKQGNRNDSSCLSSGSDGTNSSLSHSTGRRPPFERQKVELISKQRNERVDGPVQERSSNPNFGTNVSLPSGFHRSSSVMSFPSNKSVFSLQPKSELPNTPIDIWRNKENERVEHISWNKPVAESKPPTDTRLLAQEIFKKPSALFSLNVPTADLFKKPAQPLPISGSSSGIPVAVSQLPSVNSNSVLPKLNIQPTKHVYSFASDVAKYCQKEGGTKLTVLKNPQQPTPNNDQVIKVNDRSYHIMGTIGKGGSSEVYQVLVPGSKTTLAVKVVKLASVDESIADGYMNEVKLLEKLQGCASVVRMFDYEYIQESKKLYVVMEKGDTDLSRLLKDINKTKKIPIHVITYFWIEMLSAVQEIHEKGIIHSDLKPANFLLVSGRLKLIDFGIASSLQGDMTSVQKDICAGTENYISPEAIQDGTGSNDKKYKISYKSDVWSLGCILYNLIYGKTPFSHITSRWGKMFAIVSSSHKIDFPNCSMPRVLRQALQSCLIRDPKHRPTVKELLELPYLPEDNSPTILNDLPFKIQQLLPEEHWRKIAHLFTDPMKSNVTQGK